MTRPLPSSSLDAWHGNLGGRVHLSPFVSLLGGRIHLPSVVSQPGCLPRLSGRTGSFVSLCPFICLALSSSLDAWHGSLGGRVHLSPFVSLRWSLVVSQPGFLARAWHGSLDSFAHARMRLIKPQAACC